MTLSRIHLDNKHSHQTSLGLEACQPLWHSNQSRELSVALSGAVQAALYREWSRTRSPGVIYAGDSGNCHVP